MSPERIARSAAAWGISAVAKGLAAGARLTEEVATRVRSDGERTPAGQDGARGKAKGRPVPDVGEAPAGRESPEAGPRGEGDDRPRPADLAVTEPPTEPVPEAPMHVRSHETHAEELAAGTAAEVIAAIPRLSTDELGRLYEQELGTKRRKTVLEAIERAVDPNRQSVGAGGAST